MHNGLDLAPQVGLEPTTLRLTAECSTIELLRSNSGGLFHYTKPRSPVSIRCSPSRCRNLHSRMFARVVTSPYDNARTGANVNETALTPHNVSALRFGKLTSLCVDGDI